MHCGPSHVENTKMVAAIASLPRKSAVTQWKGWSGNALLRSLSREVAVGSANAGHSPSMPRLRLPFLPRVLSQ